MAIQHVNEKNTNKANPKKVQQKIFSQLTMENRAGISLLCKDIFYE